MKIHFIIIAALLMLTGCAQPQVQQEPQTQQEPHVQQEPQEPEGHGSPPRMIFFHAPDEYYTAAEMEAMTEAELSALIRKNSWDMNGIENREDALYVTAKLEACPFPVVEDYRISAAIYYPDNERLYTVNIRGFGSEKYRLYFHIDLNKAPLVNLEDTEWVYEDAENDIVISTVENDDPEYSAFLIESKGYYISAGVTLPAEPALELMKTKLSLMDIISVAEDNSLWLERY